MYEDARRGISRGCALSPLIGAFYLETLDAALSRSIERGFDFLGYHYSRKPLQLAASTVRHFVARLHLLYEQQKTAPEGAVVLGEYVTRWLRWTRAGLRDSGDSARALTPGRGDRI